MEYKVISEGRRLRVKCCNNPRLWVQFHSCEGGRVIDLKGTGIFHLRGKQCRQPSKFLLLVGQINVSKVQNSYFIHVCQLTYPFLFGGPFHRIFKFICMFKLSHFIIGYVQQPVT